MSIFETIMLLCFAASWPLNIVKSLKARSSKGKSLAFLVTIWVGYAGGIIHKILFSRDPVMALYILNFVMVGIDITLWFINRRRDFQSNAD